MNGALGKARQTTSQYLSVAPRAFSSKAIGLADEHRWVSAAEDHDVDALARVNNFCDVDGLDRACVDLVPVGRALGHRKDVALLIQTEKKRRVSASSGRLLQSKLMQG
jgi:hypothetical protein